jgi:RNA polymerase sigma-70 factor, ECF subfamily
VRIVYPGADGDAVVNAVFTLLWQRLADVSDAAARTWLRAAARHEVLNASRIDNRWYALGDRVALLDRSRTAPFSDVDGRLELHAVMSALATLSPVDRQVLMMHAAEDLSVTDLAEILGVKPDAAKARLARARARLRAAVEAMDGMVHEGEVS